MNVRREQLVQSQEVMQKKICIQAKFQNICHRFCQNIGINGTYQINPFQFQHFDMDHIALSVGGTSVPGKGLYLKTGEYMNC